MRVRFYLLTTTCLTLIILAGCFQDKVQQNPAFYTTYLNNTLAVMKFDPLSKTLILWKENTQLDLRTPMLSPDGQRVAYYQCTSDMQCNLWIAKVDGQQEHLLAGPFLMPSNPPLLWSPDGKYIALYAKAAGTQEWSIHILSTDEGDIVQSFVGVRDIAWASSSEKIAAILDREPLRSGVYILDIGQGEENFVLASDPERMPSRVVWLTDEEHLLMIARSSTDQFIDRVFLIGINDSSLIEIPIQNEIDGQDIHYSQLSPDGSRILFHFDHPDKEYREEGIVVVDLETYNESRLSLDVEVGGYLQWSRDSKYVLFTCGGEPANKPEFGLCLISLDTGMTSEILNSESAIWDLSW